MKPSPHSSLLGTLGQSIGTPGFSSVSDNLEEFSPGAVLAPLRELIRSEAQGSSVFPAHLQSQFRNLETEGDPQIFYQDLLGLGVQLARDQQTEAASHVLGLLAAGPQAIPQYIQTSAEQEFRAIMGEGPLGRRLDYLGQRLIREATDWRLIVPMMAGSAVYQLGRTATLARLAKPASSAWYARGLGLRGVAGTLGYAGEVLTFAHLSRGLRYLNGEALGPYGQELGSAAVTLGLLKTSGFLFHRLNYWAHGLNEVGQATRLRAWQRVSSTLLPQAGIFSGLMTARGLESYLGWQPPITDGGALVTETLGTMLALSAGSRLGHMVLGPRFQAFTQGLGMTGEIYARYGDRRGPPPTSPVFQPLAQTTILSATGPRGGGLEFPIAMAMTSNEGSNGPPSRKPSPISFSFDPTAVERSPDSAANNDHLSNSLSLLYANYSRHNGANPEILQAWPALFERLGRNALEPNDVETMWHMFQVVAQDRSKHFDPWFFQVSRWFGSADHHLKISNGIPETPAWDTHVDPLKFSALMYGLGLSPEPQPLAQGMRRYLMLPPELRTHFTDQMVILENLVQRIRTLSPEQMTREMQKSLDEPFLRNFLERSFIDLKDLLLEHHSHPALIYHSISNTLFGGNEKINIFRVHIDVTTFNEQDGTNFHGNVLLNSVKSWFQEKFGRVSVVQNPERTTFEFIAPSARQVREIMADFQLEVKTRVLSTNDVKPEIVTDYMPRAVVSGRTLGRNNLYRYAIRTPADLETYGDIIGFEGRVDVAALKAMPIEEARRQLSRRRPDFSGITGAEDPALAQLLHAMILKATIELKSELAAQTTYFEKELADIKRWRNGRPRTLPPYDAVFEEKDLPKRGPLAEKWERYLDSRSGYVGPGQYDPGFQDSSLAHWSVRPQFNEGRFIPLPEPSPDLSTLPQDAQLIMRSLPRLAHLKGMLSHTRPDTEGGLIQQFQMGMTALATSPRAQIPDRLSHWQAVADQLWQGFAHVHSLAVTDPRNSWTPKQHREFWVHRGNDLMPVRSNFFLQEVALARNPNLAVLEYDSFKAFFKNHATHDVMDSQFNQVRDAIFLAAREFDMPVPLVNPTGGDHISISFSDRNLQGDNIDPQVFCRRVQNLVRESFSDQPFQDYHKVPVREIKLEVNEGELNDPELLRRLQDSFMLNVPPLVTEDLRGRPVLKVPTQNMYQADLPTRQIIEFLQEHGVQASAKFELVQIYRLPMWQLPGGDPVSESDFVFSRNQPEGRVPFNRQLTVSLVYAKAPGFRDARDVPRFLDREDQLGILLGRVKARSWPHKEGLESHRTED